MHIRSLQYVFHLCSGQLGSDPYCFFPVNPFVDETDLSFEKKKKIFMPIKHHFGKNEWLKIITETTHSFCHMCTGKLIFLTSTAIVARSDCAPVHKNENMIISLTSKQSTIKKYYLMIDWMIKNRTHLKSFPRIQPVFWIRKFFLLKKLQ